MAERHRHIDPKFRRSIRKPRRLEILIAALTTEVYQLKSELKPDPLDIDIEVLNLSVRSSNALKRSSTHWDDNLNKLVADFTPSIRHFDDLSDEELLCIRNFGQMGLEEFRIRVIEYKRQHGLQA